MSEIYRWHYTNRAPWNDIMIWCRENLYHGGNYEPNWYTDGYGTICFLDKKEYAWFLLRWS